MNQATDTKKTGVMPSKFIVRLMTKTHIALNWLTGGRAFNTFLGEAVCFVTMIGAKSGKRLTVPLMYVPYQQGVLLVASLGGAPKNPVWFNNLVKNPDIEVRYRTTTRKLRARLATPAEKPELWPICDAAYPPYAEYRTRTDRDIPIFICQPNN
jgi:F420H(2)-dependent quinone reductase